MKATQFLATALTAMRFNICKDNEWFDGLTILEARGLVDDNDLVANWFVSAVDDCTVVMTLI